MKITRKDVEDVALLSRLELGEADIAKFTGQLNAILDYVDMLNKVDTTGVEPTAHVLPLKNVMRADEVKDVAVAGVGPLQRARARRRLLQGAESNGRIGGDGVELHTLKAHQLHSKLKAKEVSAVEITEAVFSRISAVEDKVRLT